MDLLCWALEGKASEYYALLVERNHNMTIEQLYEYGVTCSSCTNYKPLAGILSLIPAGGYRNVHVEHVAPYSYNCSILIVVFVVSIFMGLLFIGFTSVYIYA